MRLHHAPYACALVAILVAFALSVPATARAQSAQDKAAAEASFEEGKRLMTAHAYASACPKFADSLRRDPGIGAMLGLADCFEKNGQTASAWAEFREAAGAAARKGDKREALARDNAARLEPLLSKIVVSVPPDADVSGLAIKRDGVDVAHAEWSEAVPVDPGVHAIGASAPGRATWQTTIDVVAGAHVQTVTIPRLEITPPPAVAGPPEPSALASPAPSSLAEAARVPPREDGRAQRVAALVVGGAGVVGVVVGAVLGLHAKSKLDDSNANDHCDSNDACDAPGLALRSDAKSAALGSTIAFALGGAAIAGGVVLWLTAPTHDRPSAALAPSPRGLSLVGTF